MTIDNRQQLLNTINSQITLNGTGAITGPVLNNVLDTMVNSALFYTGNWSAYTNYSPLDVAVYNGVSYVANVVNVNVIPSSSATIWSQLVAAQQVGGVAGSVQYNNGSNGFAGTSNFTFDGTNLTASLNPSTVTATGSTTPRTLAKRFAEMLNVQDFGAVADCTGYGVGTDNTAAFNACSAAALAAGVGVYVPAGAYRLIGTWYTGSLNTDTGLLNPHVPVTGAGSRSSFLVWDSSSTDISGLVCYGTSANNTGAYDPVEISGLCLLKPDGRGYGIVLRSHSHIRCRDIIAYQWLFGCICQDVQNGYFDNCMWINNIYGFKASKLSFTEPNAFTLSGCIAGGNQQYGYEFEGGGTANFSGGSIESNGSGSGTSATWWGVRLFSDVSESQESSATATFTSVYFERNSGFGDIYLNTSGWPTTLTVTGCTFNRNAPGGTYTATGTASGNGSTATLTFPSNTVFPVGSTIRVSGIVPTGYNGIYVVTASGAGTVSYANATTGAQTQSGAITSFGTNCVNLNGVTGTLVKVSLIGNGFQPLTGGAGDEYTPSAARPYIGVPSGQAIQVNDIGNIYGTASPGSAAECPTWAQGAQFASVSIAVSSGVLTASSNKNVASVTRVSAGLYSVALNYPTTNTNYYVSAAMIGLFGTYAVGSQTTTSFALSFVNLSGVAQDPPFVNVLVWT